MTAITETYTIWHLIIGGSILVLGLIAMYVIGRCEGLQDGRTNLEEMSRVMAARFVGMQAEQQLRDDTRDAFMRMAEHYEDRFR